MSQDAAARSPHVAVEDAEAALMEHYPRLVRLAYLTLPTGLGKHRRVLVAHRLAQRTLPRSGRTGPVEGGAYGLLRLEVLRGALEFGRWGRLRMALDGVRLPHVLGLRVHPRVGDDAELALDRALSALGPEARAAFALRTAERLDTQRVRALLERAGAADPRGAVRRAAGVTAERPALEAHHLLAAAEFDPCTVQARPTDLLRRRHRLRLAAGAAVVVAAGGLLTTVWTDGRAPASYTASGGSPVAGDARDLDPAALVRAAPGSWAATARMDFTAWPARGSRTADKALLAQALAVWARPGPAVDVSATPGTPRTAPAQPPQLLFAGDVDRATVVLFYDGLRLIRYARPRQGGGRAALDFAQVQGADITTAAAVVLTRVDGDTRYLTAPWIAGAGTRDLMRPDRPAAELGRSGEGVTDPVPTPGTGTAASTATDTATGAGHGTGCPATWPVLQLRSAAQVAERHSFLLTDLGDLSPVHLTYTPPPGAGAPARQPREATGAPALVSWAHDACRLGTLRGQGVRSVNAWEFARTALPEAGGAASWTCDRADTWRGPGQAVVRFVPPDAAVTAPGATAGQQTDGHACSRFGQDVMAGVMWKSPAGHWYLLAAGSRDVTRITASHGVEAAADGDFLAVRAPRGVRPALSGRLATGGSLAPLSGG
ncbi:hypothetical protein ACFO3J_28025 [Streptomyces polygonati]|uniref:DNA-directed RNA polymerase specialized sigma24 family protein n=1 Tax=Streptomyces polygonati TaxID=1617087 RepID=A0ABV8HWQ1_9ACTN